MRVERKLRVEKNSKISNTLGSWNGDRIKRITVSKRRAGTRKSNDITLKGVYFEKIDIKPLFQGEKGILQDLEIIIRVNTTENFKIVSKKKILNIMAILTGLNVVDE
ncbi:hypothetical protein M8J77_000380 [Diaphorina citri]|nr:hypothetical protein M8J77_000380 [Diaphorina citri]